MSFQVSEIFSSIQGEGTWSGRPSFFIRFFGCNLRCGFCDSRYSWEFGTHKEMTVSKIIKDLSLDPFWNKIQDVVITGGEPLIYKDLPELVTKLSDDHGKFVTIETNGTIFNEKVKPSLFSISPKMKNSNPKDKNFLVIHEKNNKNVIANTIDFIDTQISCQVKFVYGGYDDEKEIVDFVSELGCESSMIFIMPKGKNVRSFKNISLKAVEFCKQNNYTLCPRIHIYLWGTKRGV